MALTLTIENETRLADGGPLTFSVAGKRGFDIGRDAHLDWTLPDPSRRISSKHCEVRYRDNAFWLHDVSTNGTYLNGSDKRISEPHRLRNGDRLAIGHYIIKVSLDSAEDAAAPRPVSEASPPPPASRPLNDVWSSPPPPQPSEPMTRPLPALATPSLPAGRPAAPQADFLDWMVDLPPLVSEPQRARPAARAEPPAQSAPPARAWDNAPAPPPPAPAHREPQRAPAAAQPPPGDAGLWDEPAPPTRPEPAPPQAMANVAPSSPPTTGPVPMAAHAPAPAAALPQPTAAPARREPVAHAAPTPPTAVHGDSRQAFIDAFARAAGIPSSAMAQYDTERLASLMGELLRITATELSQLLAGRFEAKRTARSSHQTQISGADNNPLKFLPTVEDALKVMLGPPSRSYLDAARTLSSSFTDIKSHQLETYVAMQAALLELADDLDPAKIEAAVQDGGLSGLVGSRKARAWDVYVARWQAKTTRHDNGILGAFTEYFSKHYDRGK